MARTDYSALDWTKSDDQLAREHDLTRVHVRRQRKKLGYPEGPRVHKTRLFGWHVQAASEADDKH